MFSMGRRRNDQVPRTYSVSARQSNLLQSNGAHQRIRRQFADQLIVRWLEPVLYVVQAERPQSLSRRHIFRQYRTRLGRNISGMLRATQAHIMRRRVATVVIRPKYSSACNGTAERDRSSDVTMRWRHNKMAVLHFLSCSKLPSTVREVCYKETSVHLSTKECQLDKINRHDRLADCTDLCHPNVRMHSERAQRGILVLIYMGLVSHKSTFYTRIDRRKRIMYNVQ